MIEMNNYTIAILCFIALNLIVNAYKHGETKKEDKYNFYKSFFYASINIWLFYMAVLFTFV